ncbi:MAG: hypothetical protein J7642_15155 [Cyanobacteria bacterium SBC]|nr:hypothetical protein [Cyanobacteria bacterium SBC]
MEQWAILSGISCNLAAYEAVLQDILRQHSLVTALYVLGDVIGLKGDNEAVIRRLVASHQRARTPGLYWLEGREEQYFSLHGLSRLPDASELVAQFGGDGVEQLWKSVYRESLRWLRSLHFGFHELDYIPCSLY